jgi:HD-like signal output (HDOD) protein
VEYLGLGTVRSLVLSAHIFACFQHTRLKELSVTRLWDHAMKTALIARRIAILEWGGPIDADETFTAGMLHDVGKLMLADNLPEEYQRALTLSVERQIPLCDAEREVLGSTHAGAAAYLLGLWGLPVPIVDAVAFHHSPMDSDVRAFGPLTAVHAANVLEQELIGAIPPGCRAKFSEDYLAAVRVQNRLDQWRAEAKMLLNPANRN